MSSTLIIGYGHLGQYAQKSWSKYIHIYGVSRTQPLISYSNGQWYPWKFQKDYSLKNEKKILEIIQKTPWINFWLPPSCSDANINIYIDVLKDVISLLRKSQLLTFISSTSVFGQHSQTIYEDSTVSPETENAKLLVKAEEYIKSHHALYHIVRPSGLVDEIRHPINRLAGRKNLSEANYLVNLVHSYDVVNFIWHLRHHQKYKKQSLVTNLSSHTHLTKSIFYTQCAKFRSLPIPEYLDIKTNSYSNRLISSNHLWQKYHYQLKYLHVN